MAEFGRIDILVNSAAMVGGQFFEANLWTRPRKRTLLRTWTTKVVGYFRTIKAVAPHMRARKWGRIISIGGLSGALFVDLRSPQCGGRPHVQDPLETNWGPMG